ncbi:TRAP transporter small permease [Devosia sp. A449]
MRAFFNAFDAVLRGIDRVLIVFGVAVMVVLVGVVFGAVVMRYAFNAPLIFSFDLSTLLFAWVVFVGLAVADRDDAHMGLDLISGIKAPGIRNALTALRIVLVTALCGYLAWTGYQLFIRTGAQIPSLRISARWLYASMPIGFGLLALSYLGRLARLAAGGVR